LLNLIWHWDGKLLNSLMFVPCKTKFILMILNNNVLNSRWLFFNVTFMFYNNVLQIIYYLSSLCNWILQNIFSIRKVTHRSLASINKKTFEIRVPRYKMNAYLLYNCHETDIICSLRKYYIYRITHAIIIIAQKLFFCFF